MRAAAGASALRCIRYPRLPCKAARQPRTLLVDQGRCSLTKDAANSRRTLLVSPIRRLLGPRLEMVYSIDHRSLGCLEGRVNRSLRAPSPFQAPPHPRRPPPPIPPLPTHPATLDQDPLPPPCHAPPADCRRRYIFPGLGLSVSVCKASQVRRAWPPEPKYCARTYGRRHEAKPWARSNRAHARLD